MIVAVMCFDRHMDEFVMLSEERTIRFTSFWFVRHDRDNRREFPAADLPNVQIGHEGYAGLLRKIVYRLANRESGGLMNLGSDATDAPRLMRCVKSAD